MWIDITTNKKKTRLESRDTADLADLMDPTVKSSKWKRALTTVTDIPSSDTSINLFFFVRYFTFFKQIYYKRT